MTILFERFLAPALVAAFVAFFVNNAIYHRRQKRSYRNDLLDSVRAYIKAGVEMAVAYFSESDVEKRVNAASQLQLFESDLREDLVTIRTDEDGDDTAIISDIELREQDFLAHLTGGTFGSESDAASDREQIRKIIASGVLLRKSLRRLRHSRFTRNEPLISFVVIAVQLVIVAISCGVGFYAAGLPD
ncbi:MAG TPA: hypothetical protein DC026_10220 [Erythrobacter sp.]|nr:hypothetical protein [Erythrobacter sp.]|tara:strand:- start:12 stop:575 length:564 start_codon:yes stop_codon:yes gene_type:complete